MNDNSQNYNILKQYNRLESNYLSLKNDYETSYLKEKNELNKLKSELDLLKLKYKHEEKELNETIRKMGVKAINQEYKDSKINSLEEEYNLIKSEYDNLDNEKNNLTIRLEKLINEHKNLSKTIPSNVLEFESALYGSLSDYYLNKDRNKSLSYSLQAISMKNDKPITNLVLLINDEYEPFYDETKAIYWTNYAYNIFYKRDYYTTKDRIAIATIFSNPKAKYYSKDKALKFLSQTNLFNLEEKYFKARCYERLNMKDEALKLLEQTYQSIKTGYRDSDFKTFNIKLFESSIKRLKKK